MEGSLHTLNKPLHDTTLVSLLTPVIRMIPTKTLTPSVLCVAVSYWSYIFVTWLGTLLFLSLMLCVAYSIILFLLLDL